MIRKSSSFLLVTSDLSQMSKPTMHITGDSRHIFSFQTYGLPFPDIYEIHQASFLIQLLHSRLSNFPPELSESWTSDPIHFATKESSIAQES